MQLARGNLRQGTGGQGGDEPASVGPMQMGSLNLAEPEMHVGPRLHPGEYRDQRVHFGELLVERRLTVRGARSCGMVHGAP